MNTTMLVNNPSVIVTEIFLSFTLLELAFSSFRKASDSKRDVLIEVVGTGIVVIITFPFIVWLSGTILNHATPKMKGAFSSILWIAEFALFLLFDDITQYWWHRLTHRIPAMYALHRAHHSATYMSIRIFYRKNSFYYLLMPGIWLSGVLVYLGLASVYYLHLIIKMTVIFAVHRNVVWDEKPYRIRALRPIIWVLERTISTLSSHSAHHGLTAEDSVTHYKGNFGNLLFVWDVLFGAAKITRRRPKVYGIKHLLPISWKEELFWPVARSHRTAPHRTAPKLSNDKQKVAQ